MSTTSLDINYDVVDEVIGNLQTVSSDTSIISSSAQIDLDNIDLSDIFVNSTGDSVDALVDAFEKVKTAYNLMNSLLDASMNMLIGVKEEYLRTDDDMTSVVDGN